MGPCPGCGPVSKASIACARRKRDAGHHRELQTPLRCACHLTEAVARTCPQPHCLDTHMATGPQRKAISNSLGIDDSPDTALARSLHTIATFATPTARSRTARPRPPPQAPFMDAVVKVYCIHTEPNYSLPWQRKRQYSSSSSGFVVRHGGRNWLLTNAHSVDYHTQVCGRAKGGGRAGWHVRARQGPGRAWGYGLCSPPGASRAACWRLSCPGACVARMVIWAAPLTTRACSRFRANRPTPSPPHMPPHPFPCAGQGEAPRRRSQVPGPRAVRGRGLRRCGAAGGRPRLLGGRHAAGAGSAAATAGGQGAARGFGGAAYGLGTARQVVLGKLGSAHGGTWLQLGCGARMCRDEQGLVDLLRV